MAKLKKFRAYRKLKRPYTRKSKFRKKSFVRATPNIRIVRFDMGSDKSSYDTTIELIAKGSLNIRQNAIESARLTSNRTLEQKLGKGNYSLKIMIYPHHMIRENPLATGAGADRMSTGMKLSFGKIVGVAARVRKGQTIFRVKLEKKDLRIAQAAVNKARQKLPGSYALVVSS